MHVFFKSNMNKLCNSVSVVLSGNTIDFVQTLTFMRDIKFGHRLILFIKHANFMYKLKCFFAHFWLFYYNILHPITRYRIQ